MPFDVNSFIDMTTDRPGSTEVTLVPPGVYSARVVRFGTPRRLKDSDGSPLPRVTIDMIWSIVDTDGAVRAITNKEENTVKQTLWIDVTVDPETGEVGGFDWGVNRNIQLARLRALFDQNKAHEDWALKNFIGQSARVSVVHVADKKSPGVIYAQVDSVEAEE